MVGRTGGVSVDSAKDSGGQFVRVITWLKR